MACVISRIFADKKGIGFRKSATILLEITCEEALESALARRQGEAEAANDQPEIEDTGPIDVAPIPS
ncbi:MAG: hypothetical protein IIA14_11295 [SAR324 cluster bacterium]|nr:hypothetical protein [SAR324 cluster bacterium]